MTKEKEKYLQQRGNIWWIYYRLPKNLLLHPDYEKYRKTGIYTQSLKTDSLVIAKKLRDEIIYNLNKVEDAYTAMDKKILEKSKNYVQRFDEFGLPIHKTFEDELKRAILVTLQTPLSPNFKHGEINTISAGNQLILDVINKKRPDSTKMLRSLLKKVLEEKKANGKASKTVSKIKRSVEWFLSHALKDDIDITQITFDQVSAYIAEERENEVPGSTLNGYLYGLRQVWERAKKSKIVEGDNPFGSHGVSKDSESYDPFTYAEVFALYDAADEDMKTLIHAAATTGARLGELITCEAKTPSTVNFKCWFFKFKDKGKNVQSTRIVPVHSSLTIEEGFKFNYSASVVTRDFKELRDKVITDLYDECTGKERKLTFHSFRSTVITELVAEKAISEKVVGSISGHLAGTTNSGSITTYIQPKALELKRKIVEQIAWK
jgi:integrase